MYKKVTVIYSRVSPSRIEDRGSLTDEDTKKSAELVGRALDELGYKASLIEIDPIEIERQVREVEGDVIFNLCEWAGLDYELGVEVVQTLEDRGVAFTGGSSENYIWGSEKQMMKKLFDKVGVPTPKWIEYNGGKVNKGDLKLPLIIKPAWEHCAIGVSQQSVVEDSPTLITRANDMWKKFRQPILIEEFIDGHEYQVTVLERKGKPWVLPAARIVYEQREDFRPMLTFESKWEENYEAELSKIEIIDDKSKVQMELTKICADAFVKLKCRGYVRFDVREKGGKFYVLEVNINPGIDWDIDYGITLSSIEVGMNFNDLVKTIVDSAMYRRIRTIRESERSEDQKVGINV